MTLKVSGVPYTSELYQERLGDMKQLMLGNSVKKHKRYRWKPFKWMKRYFASRLSAN